MNAEVHISQVKDEREYKGYIHFGKRWKFEYELKCDTNLGEIDELANTDLEAAKRQIHLNVSKNNHPIRLPSEMVSLFEGLIYPLASDFYSNPQTKGANETFAAHGTGSPGLKAYGVGVELGMTKSVTFSGKKLELLLQEHFPLED